MTAKFDLFMDAIDTACDDLETVPERCGSCGRYDCRHPNDKSVPLRAAAAMFGSQWDNRALRLDPVTMSAIMHPRFPRFGITPSDADADVIPEVINLGLSSWREAAAIVWHLAQGRPDQEDLADEASDRFDELVELANGLRGGR